MATVRIVPALHPLEDRHPRFGLAAEPSPVEHFALERGEEALGHGIMLQTTPPDPAALARHRRPGRRRRPVSGHARRPAAPAGEATARVLGGYRRTAADRGRGQAAPLRADGLAAILATAARPRTDGRGVETSQPVWHSGP